MGWEHSCGGDRHPRSSSARLLNLGATDIREAGGAIAAAMPDPGQRGRLAALRPGGIGPLLRGVLWSSSLAPLHRGVDPHRRVTPNDCGVSGLSGRYHSVSRLPNAFGVPATASGETHHDQCTCEYEPHVCPPGYRSRLTAGGRPTMGPRDNSMAGVRGCGDGSHAPARPEISVPGRATPTELVRAAVGAAPQLCPA
jgi:hypothetical protein